MQVKSIQSVLFWGSKAGDVFTKNTPAGYVRLGFLGLGFRFQVQVLGFRF